MPGFIARLNRRCLLHAAAELPVSKFARALEVPPIGGVDHSLARDFMLVRRISWACWASVPRKIAAVPQFVLAALAAARRSPDAFSVRCLVLAITLNASVLAHSAGAENTLAFSEALRLAQSRSQQLVAQDAAAAASKEMALAAGQLPDPTLKAGINNLPVNGQDRFSLTRDFMTMRSVGIMQEFTREAKRKSRTARFVRAAEAAATGRALALASLQRETAVSWLDIFYQERVRKILAEQRDEAGLQIEAADAAYRGGRGSQADVFAARSALAQIDDRIAQSERQIATGRTRLARWVGEAASRPLGLAPNTHVVPFDAHGLETELAHHPQVALMFKQEEIARADVDIARANKQADWSAELMYSQRGPAFSNMLSINVSIPLQWDQKNRQDRELTATLALAEQLRAQREEMTREHLAEARAWLQEWQNNRERLSRYDTALIPLAAERTRAAIAAYRGAASAAMGTLNAVLDARRTEIDTRLERVRIEADAARLWAHLHYLFPANHAATSPINTR